ASQGLLRGATEFERFLGKHALRLRHQRKPARDAERLQLFQYLQRHRSSHRTASRNPHGIRGWPIRERERDPGLLVLKGLRNWIQSRPTPSASATRLM